MRTIGVVTVARSDYGIYRPVLRAIQQHPELNLRLYVSGAHLSPEFGLTIKEIQEDGFDVSESIEMLLSSDSPAGIAKSMGLGVMGFAQVFSHSRPDLLVVLGDRFEMVTAALAALPFRLPVAHIHGGELTEGAMDDSIRHAMTKLSHLHFVATEEYGRRVIQMGEETWRVIVVGAPSLDNLAQIPLLNHQEFAARYNISLPEKFLLVTYHPVTLEYEQTEWQVSELLTALQEQQLPVLFTMPNADTNGRIIRKLIQDYLVSRPESAAVENLGTQGYFSAMSHACAMVGNSSSGILEAPSFRLPTVNIGTRQTGRTRAASVIDVGYKKDEILDGIRCALSPKFQSSLETVTNPFGDGNAARRIVERLGQVQLNQRLLAKRFHDFSH